MQRRMTRACCVLETANVDRLSQPWVQGRRTVRVVLTTGVGEVIGKLTSEEESASCSMEAHEGWGRTGEGERMSGPQQWPERIDQACSEAWQGWDEGVRLCNMNEAEYVGLGSQLKCTV